ncbi:MAG: ATP-binding protein, partial [Pedobacter sp.]
MKRLLSLALCATIFISCIKQKTNKKPAINPYFDKAYKFRDERRFDSAFSNFNKAKDLFLTAKDTVGAGKCLVNMAYISNENNDYLGAQEIALQASKYFNLSDTAQHSFISYNYSILGLATYQLSDHSEAQNFYDKALKYVRKPTERSIYLNNKGKAFEETGNYEKALENYYEAISIENINKTEYARILSNIALTKWLQNTTYNPLPELFQGLKIRKEYNDWSGLNSSYAYLSDFYAKKDIDSAMFYAEQMFFITNKTKRAKDRLIALRKLSLLAKTKDTKSYLKKYFFVLDSLD